VLVRQHLPHGSGSEHDLLRDASHVHLEQSLNETNANQAYFQIDRVYDPPCVTRILLVISLICVPSSCAKVQTVERLAWFLETNQRDRTEQFSSSRQVAYSKSCLNYRIIISCTGVHQRANCQRVF
jgi:hypothetical protein